jgi:hypothetical protein
MRKRSSRLHVKAYRFSVSLFNTGCYGIVFVRPGSKVFRIRAPTGRGVGPDCLQDSDSGCLHTSIKGPPHLQPRLSNVPPIPSLALPSDRRYPAAESTQGLEIGSRLQAIVVAV